MLIKTITLTALSQTPSIAEKYVNQGYEVIVRNIKSNKSVFKIVAIESENKMLDQFSKRKIVDLTELREEDLIPLSEIEKKNPYEIFKKNSSRHSQKPYAKFASSR